MLFKVFSLWILFYKLLLWIWLFLAFFNLAKTIITKNYNYSANNSSSSWQKCQRNEVPNLLDIAQDLRYISKNFRPIFLLYFLFSLVFLILFSFAPIIYWFLYLSYFWVLVLYIIIGFFFFTDESIIKIIEVSEIPKADIFFVLKFFFLITPFNWAFLSMYLLKSFKIGKFKAIGGEHILSIMIFNLPFWYCLKCFKFSIQFSDFIINLSYQYKSIRGYISELTYWFNTSITTYILFESMWMNLIAGDKKIYVSYKKIRLNGGCGSKSIAQSLTSALPEKQLLFTTPCKVELRGKFHQALKMSENSNFYCILTSKDKLYIKNTPITCANFSRPKDNQYVVFSYLDENSINIECGVIKEVLSANNLYSKEVLSGFVIKTNLAFKLYANNIIIFQQNNNDGDDFIELERNLSFKQLCLKQQLSSLSDLSKDDITYLNRKEPTISIINNYFNYVLTSDYPTVTKMWREGNVNLEHVCQIDNLYKSLKDV